MRISDWSSDVCSSDLDQLLDVGLRGLTFVGHVGSHRGNLSEENPALYRRRGCLTCFVAGNPPGTGSGIALRCIERRPLFPLNRSEERRVGKEFVITFISGCATDPLKKNKQLIN